MIEIILLDNCCWFCFNLTLNATRFSKILSKIWKLINTTFNLNHNFMNKMLQQCFFIINEICAFKFFKYEVNTCIFCWNLCFAFWCNCVWWSWQFIKSSTKLNKNCLKSLKIIFFINSDSFNSFNLLYHIFWNFFLKYCIAK